MWLSVYITYLFFTFKSKLKAIGYSDRLALVTNRKAKSQNIKSKQENDILKVASKGFSVPFGKLEDRIGSYHARDGLRRDAWVPTRPTNYDFFTGMFFHTEITAQYFEVVGRWKPSHFICRVSELVMGAVLKIAEPQGFQSSNLWHGAALVSLHRS